MLRALTGTRFGRYDITAEIARGGVYDIYRATDSELGRDVVLRVFGPTSDGAETLRFLEFQRELTPLVSLDHPHIAKVYGFEEVDHISALASELIEGPTLADVFVARSQASTATATSASRARPLDEACRLAIQIVDALVTAHERGVIHANLSPWNISVHDGVVRVRNFGLARLIPPEALRPLRSADYSPVLYAQGQTIVAQGSVWAQPPGLAMAYISPEQWLGEPADARSDIWAFGCVLFEMLTGEPAFNLLDAGGARVGPGLLTHRWTDLTADLSAAVRVVIAACVGIRPAHRIGDISLVLPALRDPAIAIGELDPAVVRSAETLPRARAHR